MTKKDVFEYFNNFVSERDEQLAKATHLFAASKWYETIEILNFHRKTKEASILSLSMMLYCFAQTGEDDKNAEQCAKKILELNFGPWPYLKEHVFAFRAERFACQFLSYMCVEENNLKEALYYIDKAISSETPIAEFDDAPLLEFKAEILLQLEDIEGFYLNSLELKKLDPKNDILLSNKDLIEKFKNDNKEYTEQFDSEYEDE